MRPTIKVERRGDGGQAVRTRLKDLERMDSLVGIPQRATSRSGDPVTNSQLLYIHTNGSPVRGIPPRPVIEPAIAAQGNKQAISTELKGAAKAALAGNEPQAMTQLDRAGLAGENAAKAWFTDSRNGWMPNSPETIRRKGSDRPLIDTGALRQAITHVVRKVR